MKGKGDGYRRSKTSDSDLKTRTVTVALELGSSTVHFDESSFLRGDVPDNLEEGYDIRDDDALCVVCIKGRLL